MTTADFSKPLLTIGDLSKLPSLKRYSRRQLEYAIQEGGIEPITHAGIIRLFAQGQVPQLEEVLKRTARRRCRRLNEVDNGGDTHER